PMRNANPEIMWLTNTVELADAPKMNVTISCGVAPSQDWSVSIGSSRFGLVEWPFRGGTECSILFASHALRVPFGAIPVVGIFATLSFAVIIAALAFRARHR